jgi:biopolymer transport protein ExbB/TolQ
MVIAFAALGQAGGQANPANISLGVSKALFHTLLGLLLALPALGVFGFYRGVVDRLCTRAMVVSWELVEGMLSHAPASRQAAAAAAPVGQR